MSVIKNPTTMPHVDIQSIGSRISKWGEGPIWWDNKLLYVDIEEPHPDTADPDTGEEQTWDMGERIGTVVPTDHGDYLYAGDSGIVCFNPRSGEKTHRRPGSCNARN